MSALATAELRHSRHELHRRLSDEQQHWLAEIYRRNASDIDLLCRSVLKNRDEAADATQEVVLRAVDRLKEASSAEDARSWLLTEARNYCQEVLHHRQALDRTGLTVELESDGDADPVTTAIDRHVVTAIFRELREHERRALWQWAVERRPLAEIAHDQGRSYKAVQQFLIRARRHALSVAARVAALVAVFQVGRAARRATQAGQLVLVSVAVPVVLATVPGSNAVHRDHFAGSSMSPSVLVVRVPPPTSTLSRKGEGTIASQLDTLPSVSVPSVPLKDTSAVDTSISTLDSVAKRVHQSTGSLPSFKVDLPVNVGLPPTPAPTGLLP